jgi:hypothetical protein
LPWNQCPLGKIYAPLGLRITLLRARAFFDFWLRIMGWGGADTYSLAALMGHLLGQFESLGDYWQSLLSTPEEKWARPYAAAGDDVFREPPSDGPPPRSVGAMAANLGGSF